MLNTAQRACLEDIVHAVHPELQIEDASLDGHQVLQLVLCTDMMCFQPLRITTEEVNVPAALAGHPEARQALQEHVKAAVQDML